MAHFYSLFPGGPKDMGELTDHFYEKFKMERRVFFFPMAVMAGLVQQYWDHPAFEITRNRIKAGPLTAYFSVFLEGEDGFELSPELIPLLDCGKKAFLGPCS